MLPVGPECRCDALQRPDGCVGIAAFQARYGSLARSDLASQLSLREAESPAPLGDFDPDPEGLTLPLVKSPELGILELLA